MTTELSIGQRLALTSALAMAVVLAAYGAIGSYTTIATTADQVGVPFPDLVPIGIDGGLIGVITLDLILAWTGHPVGWLRQLARLLTIGTVAANVSAGWPNPAAVGLHAAAPVMLLAMVEAGRAVLLRRTGLATGLGRDRIPLGRWLLSPWRTWSLWRRMVLWHITSYHNALDMEAHIRRAHTQLRTEYGRHWKRHAPADLVWMLNTAPFAHEACQRIGTMPKAPEPLESASPTQGAHPAPAHTSRSATTKTPPHTQHDADTQLDQVIKINEPHWATHNRPVSADTVREQLHISATRARQLTKTVRAMNKATINNQPTRTNPT